MGATQSQAKLANQRDNVVLSSDDDSHMPATPSAAMYHAQADERGPIIQTEPRPHAIIKAPSSQSIKRRASEEATTTPHINKRRKQSSMNLGPEVLF